MRPGIQRRAGERLAAVIAVCALLGGPMAAGAQSSQPKKPPKGKAAETIFALLNYNRRLCDGIAGKVVDHWGGLASTPEAELAAVRQFIVNRELSSLAQGRQAADIVESLLSHLRTEADRQTSDSLERIHRLEIELCDTVAYPNTSRQEFRDLIGQMLDRIEREEAELGRLLVIPEAGLDSAVAPYLESILLAGVEAEGEYRDYLESLKPPPEQPTAQELMDAWHKRYAQAVHPTKQALGKYLEGRQVNDAKLIRTACREISAAVIPLLRQDEIFTAPVGTINKPLSRAFLEIKLMATQCVAGHSREVTFHYSEMQKNLSIAAKVLAEFSLRP